MKTLIPAFALALLSACASPRYYPSGTAGEGGYYLAQSPPTVVHYDAFDYGAFQAYGIVPWWSYGYYSPYFYPHHFFMAYPGRYGFYSWYPAPPHAFPPHGRAYPAFPTDPRNEPGPGSEHPVAPGGKAPVTFVPVRTQPSTDLNRLYRDVAEHGRPPLQPEARAARPYEPVPSRSMGPLRTGSPEMPPPRSGRAMSGAPGAFPPPGPAEPGRRAPDPEPTPREPR